MDFTMELFNAVMSLLNMVLNGIFSFLPKSPFLGVMEYIDEIPYLEYICYFVPVTEIVAITTAWISAVAVFYVYQIILRWIKAVSD